MKFAFLFPAALVLVSCARPRLPVEYGFEALVSAEEACQDAVSRAEDHRIQRIRIEREITAVRESIRSTEAEIATMLMSAKEGSEGL